ncbi:CHASE2 domain-containing serine/threonine-protein kinase [Gloeothece verrucosa]|uniref:Serine/threonine protein kinase with Chase2 sensor n=1 Tax=Gloeothece verrucosa (strain PCC 7822) TaxID=497965 RepID=E0UDZ1_GLOV7|nr:CHASE2 domain-containing serine/threonine-protein kinase [Gloeothece verrucosa]ADN12995.1 serine/threonine protein kinase with Chase2 sensor [Gloeothece verrucosa PCC 7822]
MSVHPSWYLRFQKLPLVILVSLLVSGIIAGLRHAGVFQGIELWNYDQLVKLRSQPEPDPRIVLVAIDDSALKKLNSDKVSDQVLTEVLQSLEKYQPRVIGVDIIRDVPIGEGRQALIDYLNSVYEPLAGKIKPIIMTCQLPSPEQPQGIDPPPILDLDSSVGFANIEVDADQVIRRVPISSVPLANAPQKSQDKNLINDTSKAGCLVPFSLGFLTSMRYLQQENITLKQTPEGFFKLGEMVFKPPTQSAAAYRNLDPSLYQIILDYRLSNPVETISLSKVLDGEIQPEQIRDKIVLIGYTTKDDVHLTPYGMIPGVLIHAEVINQVLSNVLDKRSPIWYFPEPVEWLWLATWGLAGGVIAWQIRPLWQFYLIQGGAIMLLLGTNFILFTQQGWVPLIPSLVTLITSALAVRTLPQLKLASLSEKPLDYPSTPDSAKYQQTPVEPSTPAYNYPPPTLVEPSTPAYNYPPPTLVEPSTPAYDYSSPTLVEPSVPQPRPSSSDHPWTNAQSTPESVADKKPLIQPSQPPSTPTAPRREFVREDPYLGQRLGEGGRYRIDRHLGGGGMGQVYLASDTRLGDRPVAIKVMTTYSSSDNDNLIRRFQREAEFMAAFSSMNIVKINDFGLTPEASPFKGAPFYVMEYLQGTTLTQRLETVGKLSIQQAIPIIRQICAGLKEAHQMGIAHRDLKPDNIYLIPHTALGEIVKILDFGIAKIVRDDTNPQITRTLTAMGAFIGTYRYASPEQCLGDARINHKTDIYSLGVLMYEMLSGTNPYNIQGHQNTQGYWISSHISKKPQPLRSQPGCENISPEIEAVVMKCLEKSAEDRFANVDELEKALQQASGSF